MKITINELDSLNQTDFYAEIEITEGSYLELVKTNSSVEFEWEIQALIRGIQREFNIIIYKLIYLPHIRKYQAIDTLGNLIDFSNLKVRKDYIRSIDKIGTQEPELIKYSREEEVVIFDREQRIAMTYGISRLDKVRDIWQEVKEYLDLPKGETILLFQWNTIV